MGNTFRRNADLSDAQRARYAIISGRRDKARNRAQEFELDNRAIVARLQNGRA